MKAKVKSKLDLEERVALQDVIPLDTPFLLYVDPSSACNFRCDFCPTGHVDLLKASNYRRSVMPFALFEKLIADLAEFSRPIKVMRLNKIGEPTINKRLPEMVALAKKSGRVERVDFATNAALFSPDLLSRLVAAGLDRINISLEGMTREQYLEHAKVDIDFDGLVESIRWLYRSEEHTSELQSQSNLVCRLLLEKKKKKKKSYSTTNRTTCVRALGEHS